MSRKKRQEPEHRNPHEMRLWAIVDSLVTDISEKEAYLAFGTSLLFIVNVICFFKKYFAE